MRVAHEHRLCQLRHQRGEAVLLPLEPRVGRRDPRLHALAQRGRGIGEGVDLGGQPGHLGGAAGLDAQAAVRSGDHLQLFGELQRARGIGRDERPQARPQQQRQRQRGQQQQPDALRLPEHRRDGRAFGGIEVGPQAERDRADSAHHERPGGQQPQQRFGAQPHRAMDQAAGVPPSCDWIVASSSRVENGLVT